MHKKHDKEGYKGQQGALQATKSWQLFLLDQTGQTSRCIRAQNGGAIVLWRVPFGLRYVTDLSRYLPQMDSA